MLVILRFEGTEFTPLGPNNVVDLLGRYIVSGQIDVLSPVGRKGLIVRIPDWEEPSLEEIHYPGLKISRVGESDRPAA